jgi:hypothetical protein
VKRRHAFQSEVLEGPESSNIYVYQNGGGVVNVPLNVYTDVLTNLDTTDPSSNGSLIAWNNVTKRFVASKDCLVQWYGGLFWNDITADPGSLMYLRLLSATTSWTEFVRGNTNEPLPATYYRYRFPLLPLKAGDSMHLAIYKQGTAGLTINYAETYATAFAANLP